MTGVPQPFNTDTRTSNPVHRAWREDRIDIPSILQGRGNENASTARFDLEEGITQRKTPPEKAQRRGRRNSPKHVKNINYVLKHRSIKRGNNETSEVNGPSREGRSFAVANVGENGKIYLRYVEPLFLYWRLLSRSLWFEC